MQERRLTSFIQDENPEIFTLDEKGMTAYEKAKKDILMIMGVIDEWMRDDTLETGQKNMYCGLLESYCCEYTKSLLYAGEMEAEKQNRFGEIRSLNQENRELRKQLGEKVSLEDMREKFKNMKEVFSRWWDKFGLGHQNNERLESGGFCCEVSGMIFGDNYSDDGMTDEEKREHFKKEGIQLDDRRVIMSEANILFIMSLLKSRFPSCKMLKCESTHYGDNWTIQDITIQIRDLNDFEIQPAEQ